MQDVHCQVLVIGGGAAAMRAAIAAHDAGATTLMVSKQTPGYSGNSVIARPGALIGESALVVDTRRPATATALEHSSLWRVSRGMFLRMLEGEPAAATALRRMIAGRLEAALSELDLVVPRFEGDYGAADEEQG